MSITTLIGIINFNSRGMATFGQPSTAITTDFEDVGGLIPLGFTWHLRHRKASGDWEQFYTSDPAGSPTQKALFVAAVNGMGMKTYLEAVAATINAEITKKFGEYVGAGVPVPPKPAPSPLMETTALGTITVCVANDFKFVTGANGLPVMVGK